MAGAERAGKGCRNIEVGRGDGGGWYVLSPIRLNVQLNPVAGMLLLLPQMLTGLLRPELAAREG